MITRINDVKSKDREADSFVEGLFADREIYTGLQAERKEAVEKNQLRMKRTKNS